jgi:hypothetical protein
MGSVRIRDKLNGQAPAAHARRRRRNSSGVCQSVIVEESRGFYAKNSIAVPFCPKVQYGGLSAAGLQCGGSRGPASPKLEPAKLTNGGSHARGGEDRCKTTVRVRRRNSIRTTCNRSDHSADDVGGSTRLFRHHLKSQAVRQILRLKVV